MSEWKLGQDIDQRLAGLADSVAVLSDQASIQQNNTRIRVIWQCFGRCPRMSERLSRIAGILGSQQGTCQCRTIVRRVVRSIGLTCQLHSHLDVAQIQFDVTQPTCRVREARSQAENLLVAFLRRNQVISVHGSGSFLKDGHGIGVNSCQTVIDFLLESWVTPGRLRLQVTLGNNRQNGSHQDQNTNKS